MSSPPPNAATAAASNGDPSPLTIGRHFLRQYYHVLATQPDMIVRFYRPHSILSHGEGNVPTDPVTLPELEERRHLRERFFAVGEDEAVSFQLEKGAIDAQPSVNGGVLVVVTGHMVVGAKSRSFCHTFFLSPITNANGGRRSYYVHNDVLRFLHEEEEEEEEAVNDTEQQQEIETAADTEKPPPAAGNMNGHSEVPETLASEEEIAEETKVEDPTLIESEPEPQTAAPEEVVEETKEDPEQLATSDQTTTESVPVDNTGNDEDDNDEAVEESKIDPDDIPEETEVMTNGGSKTPVSTSAKPSAKQKAPGSWASLVASTASTPPPTPTRIPPTKKPAAKPDSAVSSSKNDKASSASKQSKSTDKENSTSTNANSNSNNNNSTNNNNTSNNSSNSNHNRVRERRVKRDPDCTLVIKGVPDGTKEAEIRQVFERFSTETKTDILGITVSAHRGLAFVDYNSPDPVFAALKEHKANGLVLRETSVNVAQKTQDNKRREREKQQQQQQGGGNTGGSGGGGNRNYRNRDFDRKRDRRSGRGNRGGRGGGSGGGGGTGGGGDGGGK